MRGREPFIRASIFDGLAEFVAQEHLPVDVAALMREFGLDPDTPYSADAYVPLEAVSHLFERAAVIARRPCFGIDYAMHYPVGASGSLGFLVTEAPSMREALENLVRYLPAVTTPMHLKLNIDETGVGYVEWMFPLEFTAAMPQYVSFALTAVILRLRHIAGENWVPLRVDLIHRALPCPDQYTALFGPRVRFDAAHNRMWLDPRTLAISHHASDARMYRTARLAGESELRVLEALRPGRPPDIVTQVRAALERSLADGAADLEAVAASLGYDARKLQYLLEQVGTTFSDELSETRKLRAVHLLSATDQPMSEIAAALGFAEMSSFTRACREIWFGMAPSKYRQRVRTEGVPPPKLERLPVSDDTGAI